MQNKEKIMSKALGYSLWLVPDFGSEVYRMLEQQITDVANKYQTPNFLPHVTLLGGLVGDEKSLCDKTQKLAETLNPYEIKLGEVGSNGTYFQVLFSKVEQTKAVIDANSLAQDIFEVDKATYFPHLSLAYGDFSLEEVALLKREITQDNFAVGKSFLAREIELWRTEGVVQDWYKVATFPLKS